ncbi:MAG: lipopolysaccharide biosynthesis protein [Dysgonamonadaceae bacterium]|jgi:O-antigen/teichoic acid export membrane protein|nr:lipopolysaccharide biosynthesis protein [Dysgonamonadaceae bacterium]
MEKSLKERTARGLFWGGFSNGIQQLVNLLAGLILLWILSPEDYGIIAVLSIFTASAIILQDSGFSAALINKKAFRHEDFNAVFWFNIFVGVALYTVLFFCAPLIADFYNKPALTNVARVYLLWFVFGSAGSTHFSVLHKKLMAKEKAKIEIAALLIASAIGIGLAVAGLGYWALVGNTVSHGFLLMLLRWHYSPWRPTLSFHFSPLRKMLPFSSKILLTNLFSVVSGNIFSNILGILKGFDVTGLYSQGKKWSDMGSTFVWNTVNSVSQPVLAEVADDNSRQKNIFRKMLRFVSFVSFPLMFGLALIAPELLSMIADGKWMGAAPVLQILCVWGAFMPLNNLYSSMMISRGKSNIHLACTITISTVQLVAVFITAHYGLYPMLAAYVAINMSGLFLWQYFAKRHLDVKYGEVIFRDILPFIAITFITLTAACFAAYPFENNILRLALKIIVASALYIGIMYFSKAVIFREALAFFRQQFFVQREKKS